MKPDDIRKLYADETAATDAEARATQQEMTTDPDTARAAWQTFLALAPTDGDFAMVVRSVIDSVVAANISQRMAKDETFALRIGTLISDAMDHYTREAKARNSRRTARKREPHDHHHRFVLRWRRRSLQSVLHRWHLRLVSDRDELVASDSQFIPAPSNGVITNNVTELAALVSGLDVLPADWSGTIFSDSWVTLQRVFHSAKLIGVPLWLIDKLGRVLREHDMSRITYQLLNGHPTKAELLAGVGKRGLPVSKWNVRCDDMCGDVARRIMQERAA